MSTIVLKSLDHEVTENKLKEIVSVFSLQSGLHQATVLSSKLVTGELAALETYVNSFNLPLFAKAILMWGEEHDGRAMDSENLLYVLKAINSLPWYSRLAADLAPDDSVLSMIVRQGFQRYNTDDPLYARIARTWIMFHEIVKETGVEVPDPSTELRKVIGVSAEDIWIVGMMVWAYYAGTTAQDIQKWLFDPWSFVRDGDNISEVQQMLATVIKSTALTPAQFRERYASDTSKYRDASGRQGYWISEFNILRDFPIVKIDDGKYASPFPTYALTRTIDGFYYDLLNDFANRKRQNSGDKSNPFDNIMSQTMGTLFERYIGRQLHCLPANGNELRGEFTYRHNRQNKESTDWILHRQDHMPVLFECKAREAVLDVQRYASLDSLRTEVKKGIGKACRQMARFILAIDEKTPGLEQYHGQDKFVCCVVLQAPLPFHMVRDIRNIIEEVATEMEPRWVDLRDRISFVPMSVNELETAVATEQKFNIPIEDQLAEYADYRENVDRLEKWEGNKPIFPKHLGEFLQEKYGNGKRIENDLCMRAWKVFREYCEQRIFGRSVKDENYKFEMTQLIAYELWERRERPVGDDQRDWYDAERIITEPKEPDS